MDQVARVQLARGTEQLRALALALQQGHSLLQVLHNEVHFGPGGTAAHTEAECISGHIHGDPAAQQHWGWPAGKGQLSAAAEGLPSFVL